MNNEFYTIINKNKSVEIRIYGEIWSYGEGSSRNLSNKLRELAKTNTNITIRVNSVGGSVKEAVAIYNIIENTDAHVTMIVEGIAASAMSFILMAADEVKMGKATQLMLHKFSGGVWGSAKKMRDTADHMDKWEKEIYPLYAEKTGMTVKKVEKEFFQEGKDVWLTPQEALNYGLVDEIVEGTVKKNPKKEMKGVHNLYNHYQTHIDNYYKPKEKPMNKEHLLLLGLPENASEAEVSAKIKELKTPKEPEAPSTPKPDSTPSNAGDAELRARIDKLEKEKVTDLINSAIVAQKITIKEKEHWENAAMNDYDAAKTMLEAIPGRQRLPQGIEKGRKIEDYTPEELENLCETDPEAYKKLLNL